jgi:hypothetical protein
VACGHAPQFFERLVQGGHALDHSLFREVDVAGQP